MYAKTWVVISPNTKDNTSTGIFPLDPLTGLHTSLLSVWEGPCSKGKCIQKDDNRQQIIHILWPRWRLSSTRFLLGVTKTWQAAPGKASSWWNLLGKLHNSSPANKHYHTSHRLQSSRWTSSSYLQNSYSFSSLHHTNHHPATAPHPIGADHKTPRSLPSTTSTDVQEEHMQVFVWSPLLFSWAIWFHSNQ